MGTATCCKPGLHTGKALSGVPQVTAGGVHSSNTTADITPPGLRNRARGRLGAHIRGHAHDAESRQSPHRNGAKCARSQGGACKGTFFVELVPSRRRSAQCVVRHCSPLAPLATKAHSTLCCTVLCSRDTVCVQRCAARSTSELGAAVAPGSRRDVRRSERPASPRRGRSGWMLLGTGRTAESTLRK